MTNKNCPICNNEGTIKKYTNYDRWFVQCKTPYCFIGSGSGSDTGAWDNWNKRDGINYVLAYLSNEWHQDTLSLKKHHYPFY